MIRIYNILCLSMFLLKCACGSNLGDNCKSSDTDEIGMCTLLINCTAAVDAVKHGRYPPICGFQNNTPVVCCVGASEETDSKIKQRIPSVTEAPVAQKSSRISDIKCQEYGRIIKKTVVPILKDMPASEVDYCNIYAIPLILGGYPNPQLYPHMALIGFNGPNNETKWLCTGSLISENFVIAPAHCLYTREYGEAAYIRLGDVSNVHKDTVSTDIQDFTISKLIGHPEYRPPNLYNDIGLFQLNRMATLNAHIRPICLQAGHNITTKRADVNSWSTTEELMPFKDKAHLLQLTVDYISEEQCNVHYKKHIRSKLRDGVVYKTQLCVTSSYGDQDICEGFSGGPLQTFNEDVHCTYKLVGISSFGGSCGSTLPDVFTRISAYIDWIESIVWT